MISDKIRAVLAVAGKKPADWAKARGITRQSMANKFVRATWTVADLESLCDLCNSELYMQIGDDKVLLYKPEKQFD